MQETKPGRFDVYRRNRADGAPHFVFSLTDTWTADGKPVPWGIDVVVNRLKAHDLWRDEDFVEKFFQSEEKREEGERRNFRNNVESFLYDFRRQFARATDGINTSSLEKIYRKDGQKYGFGKPR
jgi:hypothetical protein